MAMAKKSGDESLGDREDEHELSPGRLCLE